MAIFGRSRQFGPSLDQQNPDDILRLLAEAQRPGGGVPGMPGIISGYGGGTFSQDGSVATLPDRMRDFEARQLQEPGLLAPIDDPNKLGAKGMLGSNSRIANHLGPNSGSQPMTAGEEPSFRPMLPDFSRDDMRRQLPDSSNQPRTLGEAAMDPRLAAIVGDAPMKPKRNVLRDLLSGGLAVIGDTLAEAGDIAAGEGGRRGGGAVDRLAESWADRRKAYQDELKTYQLRRRMAGMPGMTERELQAFAIDPKAWAGSMARDATSRFGAATLNPGDQRYLGDGNGVYQAPTRGQQYAESQGFTPGTPEYNRALQDQEMGAHGPTAFDNQRTVQSAKDAHDIAMENLRQSGRLGMENVRQRNRGELRGQPTYRDLNPPPPRSSGRSSAPRIADMPVVSSPADARKLPSGTRFRTPDGRVKVVP